MRFSISDCPANGTVGQNCGHFGFAELPSRIQKAIVANPAAGQWRLPALSDGDTGEPLDDLTVVVRVVSR